MHLFAAIAIFFLANVKNKHYLSIMECYATHLEGSFACSYLHVVNTLYGQICVLIYCLTLRCCTSLGRDGNKGNIVQEGRLKT